ncbi:efflux RND transporter periplasmic adaptor subunit [Paracoccus shanxieyensis]|uniref:Efflux RND transporter periplasmic adaptor subunit n=1 Tax=Paracoccus shanxieyensis TaxID=2675752 RepID=A0A6L6J1N2_9RHOB|nr:efflux RND transporter periplasmic adaptor subunit [Paracoccus shanxieyensis]MTH65322.1 efflux RND transporter periplasmic adaptor subunit [Paracoccus shanxieyensis]MTH88373.1 efflux RND transporter periplasmic adaptor subunit [Paracoccus shanxieyensis]
MKFGRVNPAALALLLIVGLSAPAVAQQHGQDGPRQVGIMETAEQDVPYTVTLPGRAIAFQQTGIRPQVGGEILETVYDPATPVKTGDVLFRIDPETLAAALAAAEARVAGAEASLTQAQNTVTRYRRLEGSGVSAVDRANAEVALKQAEADLAAARAERDAAQLSLDRTRIVSPIDGMADVAQVSVGDLVTAGQSDVLTTITQLDPIYVDVSESSARILRNRAQVSAGQLIQNGAVQTRLTLETGEQYQGNGRMVSPGIAVSPTTGTVPIRLQFDNPEGLILPGQFLRVEMTLGTTRAVLVPQRATKRSANGTLTAFVVRDGKAQQITLSEQGTYRNNWVVTQGINPGEQLILDGLDDLRAGAEVTTVPVQIDDQGVVRDAAPEAAASEGEPAAEGGN